MRFDSGFWCGGLQITVLPAAIAGATFQAISSSGKLNGTIAATTPNGSLMVKLSWWGATGGTELPYDERATSPKYSKHAATQSMQSTDSHSGLPVSWVIR